MSEKIIRIMIADELKKTLRFKILFEAAREKLI